MGGCGIANVHLFISFKYCKLSFLYSCFSLYVNETDSTVKCIVRQPLFTPRSSPNSRTYTTITDDKIRIFSCYTIFINEILEALREMRKPLSVNTDKTIHDM